MDGASGGGLPALPRRTRTQRLPHRARTQTPTGDPGLADPAPVLHTIMYHPYLMLRFRLESVVTVIDAVNGAGPATASMAAHRFGTVIIAGERFEGPVFHVGERVERGIDMILGADYLAGRRVWLSYARRRVFVEKRRP